MSETLDAALDPTALREAEPSPETGLVRVPLPDDGLPLSSVQEMVDALVKGLPLDDAGHEVLATLEQNLGWDDLPIPALHALDGLVLTRIDFGRGALFVSLDWPTASWDLGGGFGVGAPSLAIEVLPGSWSLTVGGALRFGVLDFGVEVVLPDLAVSASLLHPASLGDILAEVHLGGSSLDVLDILKADLSFSVRERSFAMAIAVDGGWRPFGASGPSLESLSFALSWQQGGSTEADFDAVLGLGPLEFEARASYAATGWELMAELRPADPDVPASLQDLVDATLEAFGLDDPPSLPFEVDLDSAGVSLSTSSGSFAAWCDLEVAGAQVALRVDVERDAAGARAVTFSGHVGAGGLDFDLRYHDGTFLAAFSDPDGHAVDLTALCTDLLGLMGADEDAMPTLPSVELKVRQVVLAAVPPVKAGEKRRALLLVELDLGFDVGALPLVGDIFGGDATLSVQFAPRYVSGALSEQDVSALNALMPATAKPLPVAAMPKGGGFDAEVHLGSLRLPVPIGMSADDATNAAATTPPPAPPAPGGGPPGTHWVALDRTIGPLTLSRIGLGMEDREVALVLDGGVALGPVQAAALGLGVSFDLDSRKVTPQLDGLAIAFQAGAVSVAGGFLRTRSSDPELGDAYAGMIDVTVSEIRVAALGLYQEAYGGPTFFLYGFVGFSAGLRPLITVDGIALGFGYGRRLRSIPLNELHEFALVKVAVGASPPPSPGGTGSNAALEVLHTLQTLQRDVPVARGGLVFAVGLKVGLLESLVDGFVLATVSFSLDDPEDLNIQIFGAATATLPPKTPAGPWVARIEIDIVARITPAKGELFLGAVVGDGSYVLDPKAALTGGMALAVWTLGEHAGDFVFTLGGYANSYKVPSHYPMVPRLGLSWKPSDNLEIKGGLYGAVTPREFMAGGFVSASFRAGKAHADFRMAMDLIIRFKPFHYDFEVSISVSAGYGSISFSASADLHIWGPPFTGTAHISVSLVLFSVSFDVSFGGGGDGPPAMPWDEFRDAFLPPADRRVAATVSAGASEVLEGPRAADTHTGTDGRHWVVDPGTLELSLVMPVPWDDAALQIHPMKHGDTAASLKASRPALRVFHDDIELDATRVFDIEEAARAFPTALWRRGDDDARTVSLAGGRVLRPKPPPTPTQSRAIPAAALTFTDYAVGSTVTAPTARVGAPSWGEGLDGARLAAALRDPAAAARRRTALGALGLDTRAHRVLDVRGDETPTPTTLRRDP